jgi:PAS domain S-box-containing protein
MGPTQYKRTAFEAGADDYLTTPPDVIELRKRVRLYLDRAELEARLVAETRISQEMEAFGKATTSSEGDSSPDPEAITLLEHAAALTQERNMFETMLQHAGDAMAFIDAEGILRYANPAWERLTGQRLADHLNQPASWPPLTDNPETTQEIADTVARQQPWRGIITTHRADGSPLSVTMSIRPILDSGGDLRGFVVTQRDIAER